jgi:glutaredoxin
MINQRLRARLIRLFRDCEREHRLAFAATGSEDPEWPLWYADYLRKPLAQALDTEFYLSQLVYCLMNADFEHTARDPEGERAEFFADEFMEHHAPSDTAAEDRLALYYWPSCPFCRMVMNTIDRLGLEVEMRHILEERKWRDELMQARGRATVPVLRIESPDGTVRWMPESLDIVHYLEHMYGQEAA